MELLDRYFDLQKCIYDYFGYVEDWVVIPLDDCRDKFWYLDGEADGGRVVYWEKPEDIETEKYYANDIYTQRHLPKWVYRGEEYTMVVVNTHTDGNHFLQIFTNAMEAQEDPFDKEPE